MIARLLIAALVYVHLVAFAQAALIFSKKVKVNGVKQGTARVDGLEIKVLEEGSDDYAPGILRVEIRNRSNMTIDLKLSDFSLALPNGEKLMYRPIRWSAYLGNDPYEAEKDRKKRRMFQDVLLTPGRSVERELTFEREIDLGDQPVKLLYKEKFVADLTK